MGGWVMLRTELRGTLLRSRPCSASCRPGRLRTPAVHLHWWRWWKSPGSSCGRRGWRVLGFGLEHRIRALAVVTCAVLTARPCQPVWGVQPLQLFSPLGPSSLLGTGPLATAQGTCGDREQVCLSAAAGQWEVSWATSQAGGQV